MKLNLGNNALGTQPWNLANPSVSRVEETFSERVTSRFAALHNEPGQPIAAKDAIARAIMLRYQFIEALRNMEGIETAGLARTVFAEFDQVLSSTPQGQEHYESIMNEMKPEDISEVLAGKSPLLLIEARLNNAITAQSSESPVQSEDASATQSVDEAFEATESILQTMHKQETLRSLQPRHVHSHLRRSDDPFTLIEHNFEAMTGISVAPFVASEEDMNEIEDFLIKKITEDLGEDIGSNCRLILHDLLREPHRQTGRFHSDVFLEDKGKALLLDNGIEENIISPLNPFDMAVNRAIWRMLGDEDPAVDKEILIDKLKKQQKINLFANTMPSMQQLRSDDVQAWVKSIELEYDRDGEAIFYYTNKDGSRCENAKGIYVIAVSQPDIIKFLSDSHVSFLEKKFDCMVGHTSISGCADVLVAGRLSLVSGELFLDDSSGHYMPKVADLKTQLPHIYASKHIHYCQNFKGSDGQQSIPKLFPEVRSVAKEIDKEKLADGKTPDFSIAVEHETTLLAKRIENQGLTDDTASQVAQGDSAACAEQLSDQSVQKEGSSKQQQQQSVTTVTSGLGITPQPSLVQSRNYINSMINVVNIPSTSLLEQSTIGILSSASQQQPNES